MPLLNYTTTIAPMKTVGEIQSLLTRAGAKRIMVENNDNREPVALAFELAGYSYRLPCRHEAVYLLLWKDRDVPRRFSTREQGLRVAWRNLKDWVEAQVAIMECEMVKGDEVFLPYLVMSTGETMYEHYNARQLESKT
jgi:hypothetical protein